MGVFDSIKKSGADAPKGNMSQPPDLTTPPTDKIIEMRSQGLTNNQIIQNLQREEYNSDIIFKGMNLADISAGIEFRPNTEEHEDMSGEVLRNPMQFPPVIQPRPSQKAPPSGSFPLFSDSSLQQSPPPLYKPQQQQPHRFMPEQQFNPPPVNFGLAGDSTSVERIEEIAEAIIDEKWNEVVKSINKIIDWKDRTENKILQIEQRFEDLKGDFDNLSHGVLGKVGEYDKNLSDIGTEIKAMERVFQKVLPGLTENVHALERITKDFKSNTKNSDDNNND